MKGIRSTLIVLLVVFQLSHLTLKISSAPISDSGRPEITTASQEVVPTPEPADHHNQLHEVSSGSTVQPVRQSANPTVSSTVGSESQNGFSEHNYQQEATQYSIVRDNRNYVSADMDIDEILRLIEQSDAATIANTTQPFLSNEPPTFPEGRFGWEIGVNIASGFDDGSSVVDVGRGQIRLRISPGGIITEIFAGDVSFINRTLAEYYPALEEFLRNQRFAHVISDGPKESDEVMNFFKELDSLEPIPHTIEDESEDNDDEEAEPTNVCPVCRNRISADDFLVLDCQHEFHIRCIWNWRRMSRNSTCPMCRNPFDM